MPTLEMPDALVDAPAGAPDPASTESPAPADAQPAADAALAPAAETAEPTDAQPRGPDGKFLAPESTPAESGTEEAATETEPSLTDYPTFTFQSDGHPIPYDGAVQDEDGNVLFTPQAVKQLQHDLAYARAYPRRDAEAQRDLARERAARQAAELTLSTALGKLEQLFDASQTATTWEEFAETPLGQWIVNRHIEWPRLRSESLQKGFDARAKALEDELNARDQRDLETQQRPIMLARVEEAVHTWGKEAGLSEAEQQRLIRRYQVPETLELLFPRAVQNDPVSGLRAGQRYENLEVIRQDLLALYEVLQQRGPGGALAAENARRTGQTGQKAPPTPGIGRGTKPAAEKPKQYKTTREADRDIWG